MQEPVESTACIATVPDRVEPVRLSPHVRLIVPIESTPVPVQVPTMPLAGVVVEAGAIGEGDEHAARNEQASEPATRRPCTFRS